MNVYLVGGAVRDQLLNLPVKERDYVVVGSTPEEMLQQGFKPVGKDFPVFLHPDTKEEYALARTERKVGKGYKGFDCYAAPDVTLEEDLLRRDLTINAMAQTQSGEIIDPYGGQDDLKNRLLRHVSPAFREDPLRILRLARFAARFHDLGFTIAPETQHLLYEMVREGELNDLVPERVWLEVEKVLDGNHPEEFFRLLRTYGALAQLFPELDSLFGIPNPPQWHPEVDSGVHSLMVLAQAVRLSTDKAIRFAALVHDLGKAATDQQILPRHLGHDVAGVEKIKSLCDRYPIPKHYRELAIIVSRYHIESHKIMSASPKSVLNLLEGLDAFRRPQRLDEFLLVAQADARGRLGNEADPYPQQQRIREAYQAARSIEVDDIIKAGFTGKGIADELHARRLHAIKSIVPPAPN